MRNGYCPACSGGCYWREHRNNAFYFVVERVEVPGMYKDLKERYYDAKKGVSVQQAIMTGIEEDFQLQTQTP